ncbi:hypothetical protein [Parahaliea mediterranea]|uniref:EF-hand domain-containing protein n=1 Tax=Parahaliea mediterranea TaxID=651086 RepID=A0A939DFG9_9GAMM|nr:hypothetical protein [Parahaliea mediterranea]MBN7797209.1 hypothetical protein [Parahaliea mediterranea]
MKASSKLKHIARAGLTVVVAAVAAQAGAASHAKARFIEQYDLDGDGRLGSVEFEQARRERFDNTDMDRNGTVDPDEYLLEWENHLDNQLQLDRKAQLSQTEVRFKALDKDESGAVSAAEFKSSGERAFSHLDLDTNGVVDVADGEAAAEAKDNQRKDAEALSREEAAAKVRRVLRMPSTHDHRGMLALYDEDGDDRVTREEYERQRAVQFARTDRNGDGGIDADEYLREFEDRLDAGIVADRAAQVKQTHVRFGALDKDENGAMTFAEYQRSGHRSFKRWDTDSDGFVTWEEAAPPPREPRPEPATAVASNTSTR